MDDLLLEQILTHVRRCSLRIREVSADISEPQSTYLEQGDIYSQHECNNYSSSWNLSFKFVPIELQSTKLNVAMNIWIFLGKIGYFKFQKYYPSFPLWCSLSVLIFPPSQFGHKRHAFAGGQWNINTLYIFRQH